MRVYFSYRSQEQEKHQEQPEQDEQDQNKETTNKRRETRVGHECAIPPRMRMQQKKRNKSWT